MKKNNWNKIWGKRNFENDLSQSLIQNLIWMNGFDSPLGSMNESDWRLFVGSLYERLNIRENESIFELGCGAGSFLYPFYEKGFSVAGIDFSEKLIEKANEVFKKGCFEVGEANSLNPNKQYDVIFSNHVIHYFESQKYTSQTFNLLFKKARRSIYISGIPDINFKKEQEKYRKDSLSEQEYQNKYKGLDILYFDKKWFIDQAKSKNFTVEFYNHEMPGFAQSKFRFDCHFKNNNNKIL